MEVVESNGMKEYYEEAEYETNEECNDYIDSWFDEFYTHCEDNFDVEFKKVLDDNDMVLNSIECDGGNYYYYNVLPKN